MLDQLKQYQVRHHTISFWLGLLGLAFYAVSPVVFPHNVELRQPELLPVYTLMMGFGMTLKGNTTPTGVATDTSKENNDPQTIQD